MKTTNQRLFSLAATAMLVSFGASAVEQPAAAGAETASASTKPHAKPHNHMRDAKVIGTGETHTGATAKGSGAEPAKDASDKPAQAGKQEAHEKKGVKPHSHPRDAKGA
ncbi:hypothetical protein ASC94_01665 [Massilia sp. Root418]|jgi:hypothetical protein|uniref:hypothetical protein n=1 Tax=Massilia sp. Root418 TaxID=1736532 RepID=UPI0006FBAA6B|nr:hypothetical protein [Massilia sp. Root418]KQX01368.1 hypothetical protein ASC94_01665 [Massilia sp. Root418]